MILVCGGLADPVTELVCARIEHLGYAYRLLNLGLYPEGYDVDWRWDGKAVHGTIVGPDWKIDLAEVTGVFVRYLEMEGHAPITSAPAHMEEAALAECQMAVTMLLEHFPGPVANRTNASMSNQSKPYQSLLIRNMGLCIPRTLITSDPAAACSFFEECDGEVIFKSLSSVRSIVRRMEPRDFQRLPLLKDCPAQFQQFVPGDNVRVHVVSDQVFATRVRTGAVDYRYAHQQGFTFKMEPTTLPRQVEEACQRLTRTMGLSFSGIDLKETPYGEYYCFEVNPSPGFIFYERHTEQPISTALVELLRHGEPISTNPTANLAISGICS
jgi:glutathione synthase/RimK-type ligase-like ATP-grasp enzyme